MKTMPAMKVLYLDNESHDHYFRDRCIFSDEIDIQDTMNLVVQYQSGAQLSYCLNAFTSWEGYRVVFNGSKGRLEHTCQESSYINGDGKVPGALFPEETSIKIFPHFQTPYSVKVDEGHGGHGGGDAVMLDDIFGTPQPDRLKRSADYVQGAYSILTGIAANKSIEEKKMINISDLVQGLPAPGYPEMKSSDENISYVSDTQHNWEIDID
jgi:hypothetical protein